MVARRVNADTVTATTSNALKSSGQQQHEHEPQTGNDDVMNNSKKNTTSSSTDVISNDGITNTTNNGTNASSPSSTSNNNIEYSPCTNTGESHTSTIEEIQQQHELAQQLVQNGLLHYYTIPSTTNEIPIHHKRYSITRLQQILESSSSSPSSLSTSSASTSNITNLSNIHCWSSRGTVDVTAIQNLIQYGYNQKYNLQNINNNNTYATTTTKKKVVTTSSTSAKATTTKNTTTGTSNNKAKSNITTSNNSLVNNGSDNKNTIQDTNQQQHNEQQHNNQNNMNIINYWDPMIATQYNVYIRRPSHDKWGIPKIVLIYCDDFIQDIYTFPWFQLTTTESKEKNNNTETTVVPEQNPFRLAIQPILDVLQIPIERIVRMLFASLPNGSTIPVHYDTGEWVKYTHRIHVPILVNDINKIVFRCGTDMNSLQCCISCHPGHVFEINNQMYHTVSNCDTDYRVHLILDYIDESYIQQQANNMKLQRYNLQCNEIIYQTRRSIDRYCNYGQRNTPTFFILGAQKAGTTYLFENIMKHPLGIKPKNNRRELHTFDWNWYNNHNNNTNNINIQKCKEYCQSFYYYNELQYHPSCYTGDSTPSYLIDCVRVISRMKLIYTHSIQFFILCRHPIYRAISHYVMVTSNIGTKAQIQARGIEWRNKSFEQIIIQDLIYMKQCGLLPYWTIPGLPIIDGKKESSSPMMDDNICIQWDLAIFDQNVFDTFSGSIDEDKAWKKYVTHHVPIRTGSYGILSRGLYTIQIRQWINAFPITNFIIYKFEAMTMDNYELTCSMMDQVWDHLHVPRVELSRDVLQQPQNSREYNTSDIISKSSTLYNFLLRFYTPHNEQLHTLMQKKFKAHQGTFNPILFDHHWGTSSIQWDN